MSMISPIPAVDRLFSAKSVAPTHVTRFVVVENMVVAELKNGRIWTNWESFRKYCLVPGDWQGRNETFLRCLQKLGKISRKDVDKHLAWNRIKTEESAKRSDQKELERLGKKYGFNAPRILKGKR